MAKTVISHKQFHQLCEWIRQSDVLTGLSDYPQVAAKAIDALGFPISTWAIREALETTGVQMPEDSYVAKRKRAAEERAAKGGGAATTTVRAEIDELKNSVTEVAELVITTSQAFLLYSCHTKAGQHKLQPGQLAELRSKVMLLSDNLSKLDRMPNTLKKPSQA